MTVMKSKKQKASFLGGAGRIEKQQKIFSLSLSLSLCVSLSPCLSLEGRVSRVEGRKVIGRRESRFGHWTGERTSLSWSTPCFRISSALTASVPRPREAPQAQW